MRRKMTGLAAVVLLLAAGVRADQPTSDEGVNIQEMVMKMLGAGYRVMNIPTHEYSRKHGESHIKIWRQWPKFVLCVLAHVLRRSDGQPPQGSIDGSGNEGGSS